MPFVGDIQLKDFTSFGINQVKWKKALDTFEANKENRPLMVRMEKFQSGAIYTKHYQFLKLEGQKD